MILPKDYVSPEQVKEARAVGLLEYLERSEPTNLISSAPGEYRLKDHDSLKISNGKFNWFSRGIGGSNAIDFLVKVRGLGFVDAVLELCDGVSSITNTTKTVPSPIKSNSKETAKPALIMPEAHSHNDDVIKYLMGRGIDENIINNCITNKLLYQNKNGDCVFVGYDNTSIPRFACERGTQSDLKKDVAGSSKAFSFCMPPSICSDDSAEKAAAESLYVFEGPADCMSHASICKIGNTNWNGHRLSLGGVSSLALKAFLENNPEIKKVYLCLDNDIPGKEATARICKELLTSEKYDHISIYLAPPPIGTDYNNTLISMRDGTRGITDIGALKTNERSSENHQSTKKRNDLAL